MPTSTTYDLHGRIKTGVVTVLKSLTFAGLSGGIADEEILEATNFELPCIVVSIEGEQEEILGGTTHTRHLSYPVRVFVLANDLELPTDGAVIRGWRAQAMDAFDRRQRDRTTGLILPGCAEVWQVRLTPKVIFDERLKQYRHVISGFVLKADTAVKR